MEPKQCSIHLTSCLTKLASGCLLRFRFNATYLKKVYVIPINCFYFFLSCKCFRSINCFSCTCFQFGVRNSFSVGTLRNHDGDVVVKLLPNLEKSQNETSIRYQNKQSHLLMKTILFVLPLPLYYMMKTWLQRHTPKYDLMVTSVELTSQHGVRSAASTSFNIVGLCWEMVIFYGYELETFMFRTNSFLIYSIPFISHPCWFVITYCYFYLSQLSFFYSYSINS